jgi:hypothetical protein
MSTTTSHPQDDIMSTELTPVTPTDHVHARRGRARELLLWCGALGVAGALPLSMLLDGGHVPVVVVMLSALGLASAPMARSRSLGWQITARAVWWQALAFGLVLTAAAVFDDVRDALVPAIPMLVGGAAAALGAAGKVGLDHESAHFVPIAFRRSLIASLVMAMADTIALLFYAGITLTDHSWHHWNTLMEASMFLGAAAVMGVAIAGLFRLKLWALGLNIVANIGIAALAITGAFDIPGVIAAGLAATAIAQLMLPLPLLKRIVTRA